MCRPWAEPPKQHDRYQGDEKARFRPPIEPFRHTHGDQGRGDASPVLVDLTLREAETGDSRSVARPDLGC
jgi:hypothetical protein